MPGAFTLAASSMMTTATPPPKAKKTRGGGGEECAPPSLLLAGGGAGGAAGCGPREDDPLAAAVRSNPAVTPREEELEWASVTAEELREIESDLRGLDVSSSRASAAPPVGGRAPAPAPAASAPCGPTLSLGGGGGGGGATGMGVGMKTATGATEDWLRSAEEREAALLPALEAELAALPEADKSAYLEATGKCPHLAGGEHKRAFLFKENFDAKAAAQRVAQHWQYKRRLFGPDRCFLPMTLSGAMSDDWVALSEGVWNLLPAKDASGRAVLYFRMHRMHELLYGAESSRESILRSLWYLLHVAGEDPSGRRRGFVFLVDLHGINMKHFDPKNPRAVMGAITRFGPPAVLRSFHICRPHPLFHVVSPVIKFIVGRRLRKRFVVHYCPSTDDMRRSLLRFGLDGDCLPSELGGNVNLDMVKWISARMIQEGMAERDAPGSIYLGAHRLEGADPSLFKAEPNLSPCGVESIASEGMSSPLSRGKSCTDSIGDGACSEEAAPRRPAQSGQTESPFSAKPFRHPSPPGESLSKQRRIRNHRDPRMERAVAERLANPRMSLLDALVAGGFAFPDRPKGLTDREFRDFEDVSLHQRKNQLCRRLRERRTADPRIDRAACAKMENPDISLLDALLAGGFQFSKLDAPDAFERKTRDADNVTLFSRKKQLRNRMAEMGHFGVDNA